MFSFNSKENKLNAASMVILLLFQLFTAFVKFFKFSFKFCISFLYISGLSFILSCILIILRNAYKHESK